MKARCDMPRSLSYEIPIYRCVLARESVVSVGKVSEAAQAARIVWELTHDSPSEKLVSVYVSSGSDVIGARVSGAEVVAHGGLNSASALPGEVLRGAIIHNAAALIIGHNHPSGDHTPSRDDRKVAQRLQSACQVIGLHLLDSLVVSASGWSSILVDIEGVWQ